MNVNNYCIIMAGGSGTHLWPLCDNSHPRQFRDLMGSGESLLQSTFRRCCKVCPMENIFVITINQMVEEVRQQLPELKENQVLSEPLRRGTAPCVAYAASIINSTNPNANIIVTPSDHAIFDEPMFINDIEQAINVAELHDWIVLLGIKPTEPNPHYGYVQYSLSAATKATPNLNKVITFTEKPPVSMALQFINSGEFLWNSGVFVWNMQTLRQAFRTQLHEIEQRFFSITPDTSAETIEQIYSATETTSIDFGIMEKANNIYVMQSQFGWSDIETWQSLYQTGLKDDNSNAIVSGTVLAYDSHNLMVHLPNNMNVVVQSLDNYLITMSGTTLLICPRDNEEQLLKYSSDLDLLQASIKANKEKNNQA